MGLPIIYALILPLLAGKCPCSVSRFWYASDLQPLSKPSKEPVITPLIDINMLRSHMMTSIVASTVDHILNAFESRSFPSCTAAFVYTPYSELIVRNGLD